MGLILHSNQTLILQGNLHLLAGSSSASGAIIADDGKASQTGIHIVGKGGMIDGNAASPAHANTISGILLRRCSGCSVEHVRVMNVAGVGVTFRGGGHNNSVADNVISNTGGEGIQFTGDNTSAVQSAAKIIGNKLTLTRDNAIDVFGNDTTGKVSYLQGADITGNTIRNDQNGKPGAICIFIESAEHVNVTSNHCSGVTYGLFLNRINVTSRYVVADRNTFDNPESPGVGCMRFNGPYAGQSSVIKDNTCTNFEDGAMLVGGATGTIFKTNTWDAIQKYIFAVGAAPLSWVGGKADRQIYLSAQKNGFPKTVSPIGNPDNAKRVYSINVQPAFSVVSKRILDDSFEKSSGVLDRCAEWKAYSFFASNRTLISVVSGLTPGDYLVIDGRNVSSSRARDRQREAIFCKRRRSRMAICPS